MSAKHLPLRLVEQFRKIFSWGRCNITHMSLESTILECDISIPYTYVRTKILCWFVFVMFIIAFKTSSWTISFTSYSKQIVPFAGDILLVKISKSLGSFYCVLYKMISNGIAFISLENCLNHTKWLMISLSRRSTSFVWRRAWSFTECAVKCVFPDLIQFVNINLSLCRMNIGSHRHM